MDTAVVEVGNVIGGLVIRLSRPLAGALQQDCRDNGTMAVPGCRLYRDFKCWPLPDCSTGTP